MALIRAFSRAVQAVGPHVSTSRDKIIEILSQHPVGIYIEASPEQNCNFSIISEIAINLMARLYPIICIAGDDDACQKAKLIATAINPGIEFVDNLDTSKFTIGIGSTNGTPSNIFPYSNGWVAGLADVPASGKGAFNPLAAAFAGALAVAELFNAVFKESLKNKGSLIGSRISLLDYTMDGGLEDGLDEASLGEIAFVGLGAVGNSAIWTLARIPKLIGKAYLIDHEQVDSSNLQRYILALDSDDGAFKTHISERELKRAGIEIETHQLKLHEFAATFKDTFTIPTVTVSVDNYEDRRVAQALLPRLLVNGYTGNRKLGASWHRFGINGQRCLACLYQGDSDKSKTELTKESLGLSLERAVALEYPNSFLTDEDLKTISKHLGYEYSALAIFKGKRLADFFSDLKCGELGIKVQGKGLAETVPLAHQSALAGIMMAAELIKRSDPALEARAQLETHMQWPDVTGPIPEIWKHTGLQRANCICRDEDYLTIYREKWSSL